MIGHRVNNFEIVRLLGEGGMGAVYEAEHLVIRRKVAVKVLRAELALDTEQVQRFFNEARATSAIRHPNIVDVVDVGQLEDGVPFLVMELLEGESLADRLDRLGRLEIPMAVDFARQAASALEAAHQMGVIHRDLKPENLFLVPDQRFAERELVKVLDFGIAKLHADVSVTPVHTMAGAVFGTPPYMSPEQCRGSSVELDQRADIYALGIILYEMLCGTRPFVADSIGELMLSHLSEPPPAPSELRAELPPHVEYAIMKALQKRREERFATMTEFRDALGPSAAPIVRITGAEPFAESKAEFERAATQPGARTPSELRAERAGAIGALSGEPRERETDATGMAVQSDAGERAQRSGWGRRAAIGAAVLGMAGAVGVIVLRREGGGVAHEVTGIGVGAGKGTGKGSDSEPEAEPVSGSLTVTGSVPVPSSAEVVKAQAALPVVVEAPQPPRGVGDPASVRRGGRRARAQHGDAAETPTRAAMPAAPPEPTAAAQPQEPAAAIPADVEPGYLSLDSAPWSDVFLGTKLLGTTPLIHVALPPGKHMLTLKNPELNASTSYMVEIQSGKTLSRLVGWEKVK